MNKHTAASAPYIAPINATTRLRLEPAPNGGWVVTGDPKNPGMHPDMLGAFGSAADMLEALGDALGVPPLRPVRERRTAFISAMQVPVEKVDLDPSPLSDEPLAGAQVFDLAEPVETHTLEQPPTPEPVVKKPEVSDPVATAPVTAPRAELITGPWSDDEELTALSMRAKGKSNKEIAAALNRHVGGIGPKLKHLAEVPDDPKPDPVVSASIAKAMANASVKSPVTEPEPMPKFPRKPQVKHRPEDDMDVSMSSGERDARRRIRGIGYSEPWTPALDLALARALARGDGLGGAASELGLEAVACRRRWNALLPIVTIEGQKALLITLAKLVEEGAA